MQPTQQSRETLTKLSEPLHSAGPEGDTTLTLLTHSSQLILLGMRQSELGFPHLKPEHRGLLVPSRAKLSMPQKEGGWLPPFAAVQARTRLQAQGPQRSQMRAPRPSSPESLAAPRLELTGLRLSRGLSQIPGSGTHPHPVKHRLARDPEPTFLVLPSLSAPTAP